MHPIKVCLLLLAVFSVSACGRMLRAEDLSPADYERLARLGLLEEGEKPIRFSSQLTRDISGNFYSDRRLASYWLEGDDTSQNVVQSAFYHEIVSLDTVAYAGLTYAPFIKVGKKDSTEFRVCFEGDREELSELFKDVFRLWKARGGKE